MPKTIELQNQNILVGGGLLAQVMENYPLQKNRLIIAAGVSNSQNPTPEELEREAKLLKGLLAEYHEKKLIYFGSCSIFDPAVAGSVYVKHKLQMEALIQEHPSFMIVRLPQVVGKNGNRQNVVNFFYEKIKKKECFPVWKNATRWLIDVEDVARIVQAIDKKEGKVNGIWNLTGQKVSPEEIVLFFEALLEEKAVCQLADKGASFQIPAENTLVYLQQLGIQFTGDYYQKVLAKYYEKRR